ncbi:MAG: hypothetical protein ACTSRA_11920, partial [Promethearchaeota archaeon]
KTHSSSPSVKTNVETAKISNQAIQQPTAPQYSMELIEQEFKKKLRRIEKSIIKLEYKNLKGLLDDKDLIVKKKKLIMIRSKLEKEYNRLIKNQIV